MNFAALQGLTIPEGVVTQIADASGRVLWKVSGGNVVLQVEKITSDTYAGETTYTGEEFVLLDIYPKTNGTVKVTYGGLTKTISDTSGAEEPNAQQVYFGTLHGVSDSVETPTSGTLTIEGDYRGFGIGIYKATKAVSYLCPCITAVKSFGTVEFIPDTAFGSYMFGECKKITSITIPNSVTSIGARAFDGCTGLTSIIIPGSVTSIGVNPFRCCLEHLVITVESGNSAYKIDGHCLIAVATNTIISGFSDSIIPSYVTSIGEYAFCYCADLTSITIPNSVTSIAPYAFSDCPNLTSITFVSTSGWYVTETSGETSGTVVDVTDAASNVKLFATTYKKYYWYRA